MKILFVCTGNTCRSPMAQALFQKTAAEKNLNADCFSAGISAFTGTPASSNAVAVLKEKGIDISDFRSSSLTSLLPVIDDYDLFVPMTYNHAITLLNIGIKKHKIFLLKKDVPDPYGGDLERYRTARDELIELLDDLAEYVEKKTGE